ncbi:hypothetical protein FXO37_09424 [Capsicum annuum]|nr:hypothetical protein FXO37_09424 [Capsicum annuum]
MAKGNKCKAIEVERFKNSYFGGLWDLPEHMKFNGQLFHYTLLCRVEQDNKLHEMWFCINDRPACFGMKEFGLITDLNCGRYPRNSKYVKAMEKGEAFFKKIVKKRSVNAKILLKLIRGGRLDKEEKFKYYLGYDRNLGENIVSRNVTRGASTSKLRASRKTPMIENLEEHMFRLEDSIKDIVDFVKEDRLRRAEKKKHQKKDEDKVQSQHSSARAVRDDNDIKKVLLEEASLEQALINADEVIIPDVVAVVEKKNSNKGAGVEKENHDENRQDEENKNEKSICEEENNEGDGQKIEEKNAVGEVEKEEEEKHKEEGKNDVPEKDCIAEKENENEFPNIDEFLNEVTQDIDKMQVEDENVEHLEDV